MPISNWREAGNANELGHNCALTISATGRMKGGNLGKVAANAANLQLQLELAAEGGGRTDTRRS